MSSYWATRRERERGKVKKGLGGQRGGHGSPRLPASGRQAGAPTAGNQKRRTQKPCQPARAEESRLPGGRKKDGRKVEGGFLVVLLPFCVASWRRVSWRSSQSHHHNHCRPPPSPRCQLQDFPPSQHHRRWQPRLLLRLHSGRTLPPWPPALPPPPLPPSPPPLPIRS
jgi:hypothetical protein